MKEFLMRLTWVDYIAAIAISRGFYVGYKEGIFPEILRIASYIVTALIAFYFYERVAQMITLKTFLNHASAVVAAFLALLAAGFFATKIVRTILLKILKVGEGGFVMRLVGMIFGGLRWLILMSFIFMLIDRSPLEQLKKDIHTRSIVGQQISRVGPVVFDFMSHLSPQLGLPAGN